MKKQLPDISAIILDRDGVINKETGNFVKSVNEWQLAPGSRQAIVKLTKSGFRIFVATNQSGIARGLYTLNTLNDIHTLMVDQIDEVGGHIEAIHFCPHVDDDHCDCRKPKPGLLNQISDRHGVDLQKAIMVGDSVRDIQAGLSAGANAVLVTEKPEVISSLSGNFGKAAEQVDIYPSLADFVDHLLSSHFLSKEQKIK